MLGADRLFEDGSIINGIPSLFLAKKINDKTLLYIAAESFKIADESIIEDGFEHILKKLITKIFTDSYFAKK